MGLFKDMLSAEESVFRNPVALDYDYVPKLIPYREKQQRYIASCIKPLFSRNNGKNLLIYGPPGCGKTVACKHIFQEIEEETDEIIPIYINCWQKNTSYKIMLEICDMLNYRFTMNKKTDELFKIVKEILNKKSVVFCFDEADKIEDFDFLYSILEEIYRKTILLITNYQDWLVKLDPRIKSRLTPDNLEFRPYNSEETKGIMKDRMKYAFHPNVWEDPAFELVAGKAADMEDIRSGLYLMKESGNVAESYASRKISVEHAGKAVEKLDEFTIKNSEMLEDDSRLILNIVKQHSGKKIGELHRLYRENGGRMVYKTFQRKVNRLAENKFLALKKIVGGAGGTTTIVNFISASRKKPGKDKGEGKQSKEDKKLTEF